MTTLIRTTLYLSIILLASMILATNQPIFALSACTHTITPATAPTTGSIKIDGSSYQPGNIVCLMAGTYTHSKIEFLNIVGTATSPVIIRNEGGLVLLDGPTFYLTSSQHVKLQGNGSSQIPYGIKIKDPRKASLVALDISQGFGIDGTTLVSGSKQLFPQDIEVSNVEIFYDTVKGAHAIGLSHHDKPGVIADMNFHDLYIHKTKRDPIENSGQYNEGFYLGSSFYNEQNVATLKNLKVHHNRVEESGWDGIQVGSGTGGCQIYNNTIVKDSQEFIQFQNSAIMIGRGSQCDVFNNTILDSASGIFYQGLGGHIYNNVIKMTSTLAREPIQPSHVADRTQLPVGTEIRRAIKLDRAMDAKNGNKKGNLYVYNNTLIGAKVDAIGIIPTQIAEYRIFNNLILDSTKGIVGATTPAWVHHNYEGTLANLNLTTTLPNPYQLTTDSTLAINQGASDPLSRAAQDLLGQIRDSKPDLGAYEFQGGNKNPPPSTSFKSLLASWLCPSVVLCEGGLSNLFDTNQDGKFNSLDWLTAISH